MADKRITAIERTVTAPKPAEYVETDEATDGSGKLALGPWLAAFVNPKAPQGGVAHDGTGNTYLWSILTGQAIGTDPFTLVWKQSIPTTVAGFGGGIVALGPVARVVTGAGAFYLSGLGAGTLNLSFNAADNGNFRRLISTTNIVTLYGGKTVLFTLVRGASGTPVLYANNTPVVWGSDDAFGANPPANWQATVDSTVLTWGDIYGGVDAPSVHNLHSLSLYNLPLTAADVLEIYELGGAVPARYQFGSQAELIASTTRNSDFSAGATDWSSASGGGVPVVNAGKLDCTSVAGANTGANYCLSDILVRGRSYRVKLTVSNLSGGSLRAQVNGASSCPFSPIISADGTYQLYIFPPNVSTQGLAVVSTGGTPTWTMDDVYCERVGAVIHLPLDDGAGLQLHDQSSNKLHAMVASTGFAHLIQKDVAIIRGRTNTNGNQQLLGAACIDVNRKWRIRFVEVTSDGTPTVSLGSASAGAQYVSGAVLTAAQKELTLVTPIISGANLWVISNSTANLDWTIILDAVD
jgi:hypothetical protein